MLLVHALSLKTLIQTAWAIQFAMNVKCVFSTVLQNNKYLIKNVYKQQGPSRNVQKIAVLPVEAKQML